MNQSISGRLIGDAGEQVFRARTSGKAFSPSNLWVNRLLHKQVFHLLQEYIGSQEHSRSQFTSHINSFPFAHELVVCTYYTNPICVEL